MSLLRHIRTITLIAGALVSASGFGQSAAEPSAPTATAPVSSPIYVPVTVSDFWQGFWRNYAPMPASSSPGPDDIAGWDATRTTMDAVISSFSDPKLAEHWGLSLQKGVRGGVPVLEVTSPGTKPDARLLIYVHGGAYTFESAQLCVLNAALMARATGLRVISIDYTLAPRGKWQAVTEQVVAVYRALLKEGRHPRSMGMYGESAGGGLVAGAVLKMRDLGIALPGALVLWSPWADITAAGDSYGTLSKAEPFLTAAGLQASADAYALRADQKNPYVSPVYGDFSRGFPPTLIQGGTKEIFLSHFIRLYQAIDSAGGEAKLDLYDGMPHVFQIIGPDSPEGKLALAKSARFMAAHLATK